MPAVKTGRVSKPATGRLRPLRKMHSKRGIESLPLVERANELPLGEFTASYCDADSPASLGTIGAVASARQNESQLARNGNADAIGQTQQPQHRLTLELHTPTTMSDTDLKSCFRLLELTSAKDYKGSSIGWSPSKKRKEMKLPDMKYLILRQQEAASPSTEKACLTHLSGTSQVAGFLSFMVTYEDGKEVIYCYEIHLSPAVQGQGLGNVLMSRFEEIGKRIGLEKAMLTVFTSNSVAQKFYDRLGYRVDEYSPPPRILRSGAIKESDYLILSKPLNAKPLLDTN